MHAIPKSWDEWIPINTGKAWEETNIPKLWVPKYFTWRRNPNNSITTGWVNEHITEQGWENTDNSQVLLYLADLELVRTMQPPMSGNVEIPITSKYSVESHIILRPWVFEGTRGY